MHNTKVISLGGSIVAPDGVDTEFLTNFRNFTIDWLSREKNRRLILIIGGGGPARHYQQAYRNIVAPPEQNNTTQDWIGIKATHLNAQLVKSVFGKLCVEEVVTDPYSANSFEGQILVGAGWKPGFSTDYDAVLLAEKFGANTVINLSNIAQVYTADPKKDPQAKPLENISWKEFKKLVGEKWIPGKNLPFDPVATKKAAEMGLTVICGAGNDIENTRLILDEKKFFGTRIGPQ